MLPSVLRTFSVQVDTPHATDIALVVGEAAGSCRQQGGNACLLILHSQRWRSCCLQPAALRRGCNFLFYNFWLNILEASALGR